MTISSLSSQPSLASQLVESRAKALSASAASTSSAACATFSSAPFQTSGVPFDNLLYDSDFTLPVSQTFSANGFPPSAPLPLPYPPLSYLTSSSYDYAAHGISHSSLALYTAAVGSQLLPVPPLFDPLSFSTSIFYAPIAGAVQTNGISHAAPTLPVVQLPAAPLSSSTSSSYTYTANPLPATGFSHSAMALYTTAIGSQFPAAPLSSSSSSSSSASATLPLPAPTPKPLLKWDFSHIKLIGGGSYGDVYRIGNAVLKVNNADTETTCQIQEARRLKMLQQLGIKGVPLLLDEFDFSSINALLDETTRKRLNDLNFNFASRVNVMTDAGDSLTHFYASRFDIRHIRSISYSLLHTLARFKKARLIHGDLKPDNIRAI